MGSNYLYTHTRKPPRMSFLIMGRIDAGASAQDVMLLLQMQQEKKFLYQ